MRKLSFAAVVLLLFYIGCTQQKNEPIQSDEPGVEVFPQLGHTSPINAIAVSSDGKFIFSGSGDDTIKMWDIATGKLIRTFEGHYGGISSIAISPDNKYIVSAGSHFDDDWGSYDKFIALWDISTGSRIKKFEGHENGVNSVAFSPDGKYIVSGSGDNTLKLWDVVAGTEVRNFDEHTSYVWSVCFSPDGKQILSGSNDNTLKLWDAATGNEIRSFHGHKTAVYSACFSPDGKQVLSGSWDNEVKLWDTATGSEIRTFSGHASLVRSVTFSPDGKQILSGSWDGIKLWDITTGEMLRDFTGDNIHTETVAFSIDGKYIFSDSGNTIKMWDVDTGKEVRTFKGSARGAYSIAINSNGIFAHSYQSFGFWDFSRGQKLKTLWDETDDIRTFAISPDGKYALSGSRDNTLKLWNIDTGKEIRSFGEPLYHGGRGIVTVAFTPDGKYALASSWNSPNTFFTQWDVATGHKIKTFNAQDDDSHVVGSITMSSDGKYALSADTWSYARSHLPRLWDINTGEEIRIFKVDGSMFSEAAISSDGKFGFAGSIDQVIYQWDINTGDDIKIFEGHRATVNTIALSPNGKYLLSGSHDSAVKLWDVATGQEIRTFRGHSAGIQSVRFSPDGKRILSCSTDGTTRLWDTFTGEPIASFITFDDGEWIVITPDGYYNASPRGDQHINVSIGNEVFGIEQFATAFYQPEVVQARLLGKKDPPVVKLRGDIRKANAPPKVDITVNNQDDLNYFAELAITISDPFKPIGETEIEITVNGRLLGEKELQAAGDASGIIQNNTRLLASSQDNELRFTISVRLDPGFNLIEVTAANDFSYGFKTLTLNAPETETPLKGDLLILAIGVNKYVKNKAKSGYANLTYPASDAEKIINSLRDQCGPGKPYDQIHIRFLSDNEPEKPTKQAILESMDFLKQVKPNDTVILLLSGHGKTQNGIYYFLPSDTVFTGNEKFKPKSAVDVEELVKALDIPGRKILLLDTCDSGGANTNNRLVRTLKNRSTLVFTASQDGESAWENRIYGGYFTHSIAEGLNGKAANEENKVQIISLGEYIAERVGELNKETNAPRLQHPMRYIPDGFQNFVISMVE